MTTRDRIVTKARAARDAFSGSVSVFLRDVGNGLLEVSHNSLALVGLVVVAAVVFVFSRADLPHTLETTALGWLQARHVARAEPAEVEAIALAEPDAVSRATASDPSELTRQQAPFRAGGYADYSPSYIILSVHEVNSIRNWW